MTLSDYLAKNYLTASGPISSDHDSTRPRKRRKKDKSIHESTSTLVIADDDDDLLSARNRNTHNNDNDLDLPLYDTSARSAEFRRSKKNNWKSLASESTTGGRDAEQDAADRILADAAAELDQARAEIEMDDAPAIVEEPKMESGARAGLQTVADTMALEQEEERRRNAERKAERIKKKSRQGRDGGRNEDEAVQVEDQTIYRDATGRRIDVSMKRAEARAAEAERLRLERKEKEDAMGEVQKQQKEARRKDLEEAKFLTVARGADDEDMNEELKGRLRWDDPMAGYMMQKEAEEGRNSGSSRAARLRSEGNADGITVKVRRKEYQGAAPPNRYGIKPGWRWDGVDRGNGFEKEWFQARGRKSRNENLKYQWQMDE